MPKNRRRDERDKENFKILVKGTDVKAQAFQEQTEIQDISAAGASFYLETPIQSGSFLTIEIPPTSSFGHLHTVRAAVVRLETASPGRQFVAVRFY